MSRLRRLRVAWRMGKMYPAWSHNYRWRLRLLKFFW